MRAKIAGLSSAVESVEVVRAHRLRIGEVRAQDLIHDVRRNLGAMLQALAR